MPQKTTSVDESGRVIGPGNPLDVGGSKIDLLAEVLHQILDELRLQTVLLKEVAK